MVLVPGVTGGRLRETGSGRVLWGRTANLMKPRDGAHILARPLAALPGEATGSEAFGVLEELRFFGGLLRKPIYKPVVRLMEANGYRRGDLAHPAPDEDFFAFGYDWRDDLVVAAQRLAEGLERLRRVRGEAILEVDLICQSAGGQICRYLAKYGGASLEAVESGSAEDARAVRVGRVILVGTANGGSMRILREIHRGRTYVPGVGRKMQPEVLFTFAALYQDLPVYREGLFVDEQGKELDVDLMDAATWREYGFSIFSPASRERVAGSDHAGTFGDKELRLEALERFLDRSARLHAVLRRDVADFDSRYYSIQNVEDETPERAVLVRGAAGTWDLLFTGDRALRKMPALHAAVTTLGDGHASQASQLWLSPQETAAVAAEPLYLRGDHFAMILDPSALERILEYLTD